MTYNFFIQELKSHKNDFIKSFMFVDYKNKFC